MWVAILTTLLIGFHKMIDDIIYYVKNRLEAMFCEQMEYD